MNIITHTANKINIAEIIANEVIFYTAEEAKAILADLYYQDFDGILFHQKNLIPLFFDLKNGMAGEVLQAFANFRMRLAIIGNFEDITSQSLKDFIFESNKGQQVHFSSSVEKYLGLMT